MTATRLAICAMTARSWEINSNPKPKLLLQALEKIQNLRLHGDVQGCCRLVGDQEFRAIDQGHGDQDALALTAGELVRVFVAPGVPVRQLRDRMRSAWTTPSRNLLAAEPGLMGFQRLCDLSSDWHHGVQRCHRLLEDHGDLPLSPIAPHLFRP